MAKFDITKAPTEGDKRYVSAFRVNDGPEVIQGIFDTFKSADISAKRKFASYKRTPLDRLTTEARTEVYRNGAWVEV